MNSRYDVVILGAGPSGSTASLYLSQKGIRHLLIDKCEFPRDKICGDALSGKVVYTLNRVAPGLVDEMVQLKEAFHPSWGISFYAPNGKNLEVPFKTDRSTDGRAPGFIASRADFDNFLFSKAKAGTADVVTSIEANQVDFEKDSVNILFSNGESTTASILIDATGAHSKLARLLDIKMEPLHHSAGLRQYYEGVEGLDADGFIELHFIKDILPGYFWIFPMTNNRANVGIGMLSDSVSKKKVNLKEELKKIIEHHPEISNRFKNAKPLESPRGWGLPMGSKKRNISSDRFIITGDAASLIDPFTGEGIGNGMISGRFAGEVCELALQENRFDADFLKEYDKRVYKYLGPEFRMSHQLQKMVNYPSLFNFVVNKGRKSKEFRDTLTAMFESVDLRKKFRDPRFYLRLLLNK
ncbi:MAG: geranylgeranyl reductase family protein [Bacteroidetes bacterium]|nr:geranylgeranyl reductase family protein [Bacteroidota bacterium]